MAPLGQSDPLASFVDVFAGCGGLSLGLKRAGWKGLLAIEKDPFAFETLSANFPERDGPFSYAWPDGIERRAWDIRELLSERKSALTALAGKVGLLAGGPPCQGVSQAGPRQAGDPRNTLFEAYLELVELLRPHFVLVENVRGFASDFKEQEPGRTRNFADALKRGLRKEYDIDDRILRSSSFGVPQMRPRFFLVGARKDIAVQSRIESFFDDLKEASSGFLEQRNLPLQPTASDAISDLETERNGTGSCGEFKGFKKILYKKPLTPYQKFMHADCKGDPSCTRLARHRPDIRDRFTDIIEECKKEGRLNVSLSTGMREKFKIKKSGLRVMDPEAPAPTVTSLPDDLLHYAEPRTLTVRENARLQSFPDWFEFKGKYTTGGLRRRNEVPRFTQVANAVPPLIAEQFGLALLLVAGFSD